MEYIESRFPGGPVEDARITFNHISLKIRTK